MNNTDSKCVQERYAPNNMCYGCGSANKRGIGLRSFVEGDELIASWHAEPYHQAFEGMLCGGVIGTLLDCHCNWAGALQLMQNKQLDSPPCTVTAEYKITLKAPTPIHSAIQLYARVVESNQRKAVVEGELIAENQVTATCAGIFVAVKEGHPAFHRW